ncbi:hypothetical protein EVJ32_11530 [Exiguobacterium sp. SH5S4]|uniref:hypothetical protein n=1 Tax=Exiguobacterium sp. SH5S4 TaxID=2510961 RepID=UPI00103D903A|nr:hypothetical protein [Exiguobacterium sp. SH5S4]TCI25126.1 hypothetical protein EVJ32_11530 [Exiguobacterium sp. SH5S4]
MHVSERLLQLYADVDASTRTNLQTLIKQNLGDGKSLTVSFEELTGATKASLPTDEKSAADFTAWIKDGKKDVTFLPYYVSLLEKHDRVLNKEATVPQPIAVDKTVVNETTADTASEKTPQSAAPAPKPRYVPETSVPSRAERAKRIEPARPRKKKGKWLGGLLLVLVLLGGGYIGYPYVAALFEPSETAEVETTTPEPEPVAEAPAVTEVWLTEKNVDLVSEPNGTNVTYTGDIGDRYDVLEERDDHVLLDLGVDDMNAWAPMESVTTDWKPFTLSDQQVLNFLQTGVDQTYLDSTTVDDYLSFSESELYEVLGQPYGRDDDALNDYAFYNGIFFVIQDEAVHAIDWTNTPTTKEAFKQLGRPVYETEDAIVFESPKYSLRMFVGENGTSTRIRVTEI